MPIISAVPLQVIDQEEFAAIDYRVMGCAFDCHNEFGRLCDEVIYQQDMAARLVPAGLGPVRTNVPVTAFIATSLRLTIWIWSSVIRQFTS